MDKQSGDEVARLASKLMQPPLIDEAMANDLIHAIAASATATEARGAIRRVLEPLERQVRRIAASVVSQADGNEK